MTDNDTLIFIEKQIDNYVDFFKDQIENISKIENNLFKKIILCTTLDTLAIARFSGLGVGERFKRLISECTFWGKDANRISLPQLYLRLFHKGVSSPLVEYLKAQLELWQIGKIYRLDVDPELGEVQALAIDEELYLINKSSHLELLYTYRNHLIHESRQPGYGLEFSNDNSTPYYHGYGETLEYTEWELVYPTEFFFKLTRTALENVALYLKENKLDPFEAYGFSGTRWKINV